MLKGPLEKEGYDWWWHNFTGFNKRTGEAKTFFIEYFVCNPGLGEDVPVLGQVPEHILAGRKPSYAMIKVGVWGKGAKQIHNFYPISEFSCPNNKLRVQIKNCILTETYMSGSCNLTEEEAKLHPEYMCDGGTMSWKLTIDKKIAYHVGYGASKLLRKLNAFEMFWHAEGIKTAYAGEVVLDGEVYEVIPEKSAGYADKNWGSDFTSPWLWISSCNMKSLITGKELKNSAVEFGGGRPKVFGMSLDRKILGGLYYEGKMFDYNFSKFWKKSHLEFSFKEGKNFVMWKIIATNRNSELELMLKCPKDEMILINYESPNGKKLHNQLWNGGTGYGIIRLYDKKDMFKVLIDEIEMKNVGCEYGEYSE
jgi:hypothetical protein